MSSKNVAIEKLREDFSLLFNKLKKNEKLSYEEIAEALDKSVDTIKSYNRMKNSNLPDFDGIRKIAKLFNVSADYLLMINDNDEPINFDYFVRFKAMAKKLGFHMTSEKDKLIFECTNPTTLSFFEQLKSYNEDEEKLNKSILINFGNELITKSEYEELRKDIYLYGHNLELPNGIFTISDLKKAITESKNYTNIEEYEEDGIIVCSDEEYGEKHKHWNETNGQPTKYISDEYYDLFYKAKNNKKEG